MKNFYLFLTTITAFFLGGTANAQCDYTITMNDTWGDGWNGANCEVYESGSLVKTWLWEVVQQVLIFTRP